MEVTFENLYAQTDVLYKESGQILRQYMPIGFWFEVDRETKWDHPDPPELVRIGNWIAANEKTFRGSYRTTRRDCGFVIVFKNFNDSRAMLKWLQGGTPFIETDAAATLRRGKRRTKYNQLPGAGDRQWSEKFDKKLLKPLRILTWSPFSYPYANNNGELYVPVTELRHFSLNW
jgi:hypothetical protein